MVHTPSNNTSTLSTMALIKCGKSMPQCLDSETANQKLAATETESEQFTMLRQATKYFSGIEKPLKCGPAINTLTDLIAALHKEFATDYVNIEMVNHIMMVYKSNLQEWKRYAKFDRCKYTRNLVDAGNGKFNLLVLCWGEGHASAIHDHADSHCFMKMLTGTLCETRYVMPPPAEATTTGAASADIGNGSGGAVDNAPLPLQKIGQSNIETNDVAYINDNLGLHRIENASHSEPAVSLHLYCPPFEECSVFQGNRRVKCPVTFWSEYGVRLNKE